MGEQTDFQQSSDKMAENDGMMDDMDYAAGIKPSSAAIRRAEPKPMGLSGASVDLWQRSFPPHEFAKESPEAWAELRQRLGLTVISMDTFSAYRVRGIEEWGDFCALMYPRFRRTQFQENERPAGGLEPSGLKVIRLKNQRLEKEVLPQTDEEDRKNARPYFPGIFGWHMVTPTDRAVILTTNEKDALAVFEATGEVALALPNADKVDYQVLPFLEEFDFIYLWYPPGGLEAAKEFAHVISPVRTYIVTHPERPLELLQSGRKARIGEILKTNTITRRAYNNHFRTSAEHRIAVRDGILNYNQATRGLAQFTRWPILNKIFGGFRGGEVTILTGPTGVGKTTFLCEYVVDLAKQGVRTLFCSFEMPESRVLQWMACQFAHDPLDPYHNPDDEPPGAIPVTPPPLQLTPRRRLGVDFPSARPRVDWGYVMLTPTVKEKPDRQPLWRTTRSTELDRILDRFERMEGGPITLNSAAFSGVPVNKVAEAIRDQVLMSRTAHVVIDNLQFLVGAQHPDAAAGYTRFDLQDAFVGLMRRLSTDHQCHVTIVAHMKKTEGELTLNSIYGGARLTQEADNVIAIDRVLRRAPRREVKVFKVLKNRYNGNRVEDDSIELHFNATSLCHRMEASRFSPFAGGPPDATFGGGGILPPEDPLLGDADGPPPVQRGLTRGVRDRWR